MYLKQKKTVKGHKNKQTEQSKIKGNKEVEVLEFLEFSEKQFPSMEDCVAKRRLNSKTINELKQNGE